MLPPLCYAVFGIVTPLIAKRFDLEPTLIVALVALSIGLLGRGLAGDALGLVAASTLTFAAIGVGNVLLPPLVKRYFPDRVGLHDLDLRHGPVGQHVRAAAHRGAGGGCRGLAGLPRRVGVVAALSLVPWIALVVHPRRARPAALPEEAELGLLRYALRSPLAWALAIVFAIAGFNAYALFAWLPPILHDIAGTSPAEAGALLSLYAAMGLPAGLIVPIVAARYGRVRLLVGVAIASFVAGYLGLLLAPATATWLWVALMGIGPLFFPLSLVLINLRSRTHSGAVALSGFVQSAGYLIVADRSARGRGAARATGGWTWPLVFLLVARPCPRRSPARSWHGRGTSRTSAPPDPERGCRCDSVAPRAASILIVLI